MSTKEQGGLSRRSFLKGAGVAAAAVAGSAALAGCSSDAGASQEWLPASSPSSRTLRACASTGTR